GHRAGIEDIARGGGTFGGVGYTKAGGARRRRLLFQQRSVQDRGRGSQRYDAPGVSRRHLGRSGTGGPQEPIGAVWTGSDRLGTLGRSRNGFDDGFARPSANASTRGNALLAAAPGPAAAPARADVLRRRRGSPPGGERGAAPA